MNQIAEEILQHYGMPRRSGRYPYGSGEDPYQHGRDFLGRVEELKKTGWTETPENIKKEFGLTTTQYRIEKSLCKDERRSIQVAKVKSLKEDGLGATEIGKKLGIPESTVRSLLNYESEKRMTEAKNTADHLKKLVDEKGMIDVGVGTEIELNISKEKLETALYLLEKEGYNTFKGGIPQINNPGQQTNQKVLCPPGTPYKVNDKGQKVSNAIYDFDNIHTVKEYISRDGGETFERKFTYPESLDSKRLMIKYKEDGGIDKDGIVELRRGVPDLSLGESRYSQVRILVDGTHYIKGMAVYSDNMPDGVDVVFNTNKSKDIPMKDVLKKIKNDPDNPFGSLIKDANQGGQYWYDPETGERVAGTNKKAKLGLINKRADEGDWDDWADSLPSQFLGKQSLSMANKQLGIAKADKQAEFEDICSINNPTIKKHFLNKFADECDAAAIHLKAAALPGQKYHVIIPVNTLKDTEVYAPNYKDGTKLALVRYPHGGTFEIPILTVNNKHAAAKKLLGSDVIDAIGINSKVAERLSGADFDGDTAMCIPTHDRGGKVKIKSSNQLEGLVGFDPKTKYGYDTKTVDKDGTEHYYRNGKEFKVMSNTQIEMGMISNLITDMTLYGGATDAEKAAAVRHSMVVIDAEKHKLDYRQSEMDNNIKALKLKYQARVDEDGKLHTGAATILSRSKGQKDVLKRQGTPKVNTKYTKDGKPNPDYDPTRPEGALLYKVADDAAYTVQKTNKRTGVTTEVTKYKKQKSTQMAEVDDAHELVSKARNPMELAYADYANSMKDLANKARLESFNTGKVAYSPSAKKVYEAEVKSLNDKLDEALANSTKERAAQRMANAELAKKKLANPDLTKEEQRKIGQQALNKARQELSSASRRERNIKITDREWEAIQSGAISENKLEKILNNADVDELRQRATPRASKTISVAQANRIKAMSASHTLAEIADKLGVSTSTISKVLKGE